MDGIHSRDPDDTPKTSEEATSTTLLTTSRALLGPPVWIFKTRVTNEWAADCCPALKFLLCSGPCVDVETSPTSAS